LKILVTGGTGFIGANLTKKLCENGNTVWFTGFPKENSVPEAKLIDYKDISYINFDACFHQAANNNTLDQNKEIMMIENVHKPKEMFEILNKNGCKRFIYASSTAVYGNEQTPYKEDQNTNPLNTYAKSKLEFEKYATEFEEKTKNKVFGLRYCNVYGPGEYHKEKRSSMILQIIQKIKSGKNPKIFKDGNQKRDWIYIKDVIQANLTCLNSENSGIFNIAGGKSVSFNFIINKINQYLKTNKKEEYIDCNFLNKFQNNTECDISKAKKMLNWSPEYGIEQGIKEYLSLLRPSF